MEGDHFFIMDEDIEQEVVVCPPTEEEADAVHPYDVLIEDEACSITSCLMTILCVR